MCNKIMKKMQREAKIYFKNLKFIFKNQFIFRFIFLRFYLINQISMEVLI